jgi:hypothetical protein
MKKKIEEIEQLLTQKDEEIKLKEEKITEIKKSTD